MQHTKHYSLNKPEGTDYAKIIALNDNADKIDAALKALSDALGGIDLSILSQAIQNVDNKVTQHLADMVQHNQFMDGPKKIQVILGWNKALNCPTMEYTEVI